MTEIKPKDHMMKLQGKDYLPVPPRTLWARQEHPDWGIINEHIEIGGQLYMKCTVRDETGRILSVAHKRVRSDVRGPAVQFPLETAETGAVGRALGLCGYGTLAGDLDEGEDIADAPVERHEIAHASNGRREKMLAAISRLEQAMGQDRANEINAIYYEAIGDEKALTDASDAQLEQYGRALKAALTAAA